MSQFLLVLTIFTIVAGLTAVSIWDMYNIITDYIYDNCLTLSTVIPYTLNEFPYISWVQIRYMASPFLFLPRFSLSKEEYMNISTMALLRQDYEWPRNISDEEAQVYKAFFDLKIYYDTGYRDLSLYGTIGRSYSISDQSELNRMADRYVSHPNSMFLAKQAWLKLRPLLLQYNKWADNTHILPDLVHEKMIILTIANNRTAGEFGYAPRYPDFYLDSTFHLDPNNTRKSPSPPTMNPIFVINGQGSYVPANVTGADSLTIYTFTTANSWVSSRRNFPPCDDVLGSSETDCLQRLQLRTVFDLCGCMPLLMALKESFQNFQHNITYNRPFCTENHYAKCKSDYDSEIEKRQEEIGMMDCKPCVTYKNSYEMDIQQANLKYNFFQEEDKPHIFGDQWRPRTKVTLQDDNNFYLYFEQKQQLSAAQLISQVGGDLGLYTGFSMLTILEGALFLYRMFRSRKRRAQVEQSQNHVQFFLKYTADAMLQLEEESRLRNPLDAKVEKKADNNLEEIVRMLDERDRKFGEAMKIYMEDIEDKIRSIAGDGLCHKLAKNKASVFRVKQRRRESTAGLCTARKHSNSVTSTEAA